MTRTRSPSRRVVTLVSLAALAGCGGVGGAETEAERPQLDVAVAERLAAASDAVADALDQNDVCTAAHRADELRAQVIAAINANQVPAEFQEDLTARANELVNEVNCPPPPQETDEDEEGDDKGNGEKKDEKKNDEVTVTVEPVPVPTTPETTDEP